MWTPPLRIATGTASSSAMTFGVLESRDGSALVDIRVPGTTTLRATAAVVIDAGTVTLNGTAFAPGGAISTPGIRAPGPVSLPALTISSVSAGVLRTSALSAPPGGALTISAPVTAGSVELTGSIGGTGGAPLIIGASPVRLGVGDTALLVGKTGALRCVNGAWAFAKGNMCIEAPDGLGRTARFSFSQTTDGATGYPALELYYSVGDARSVLMQRWVCAPYL